MVKSVSNSQVEYNTVLYIVAMLKEYGIKNIVACPGMQDAYFCSLVQEDSFFNCYSVVDERSAVYVATGLSHETDEPTVVVCTGATASRNFLSGMTEAYYRDIPVIAISFYNPTSGPLTLSAQYVDRSVTQNDIKRVSVTLPRTQDQTDLSHCLINLNYALSTALYKKQPVHINAPSYTDFENKSLPDNIWSLKMYEQVEDTLKTELKGKNVAIYVGAHKRFTKEEENAISEFAVSYDAPVVCNHSSSYHGKNKILASRIMKFITLKNKPDFIIDMGDVNEDYYIAPLLGKAKEIWRISPNGDLKCRKNKPIRKLFTCSEYSFFNNLVNESKEKNGYYTYVEENLSKVELPELPLCNSFICQELSKHIKKNSSLHLAILNSARGMNFFELDESIDVNCNTGGFGIDGALSTLVGQSLSDSNKTFYGVIGDLAFFYDMNILGSRHIGKNIKVILVNNNRGEEFRLNPALENPLAEKTDLLIAAANHYKNGAKAWIESCGLHYMSAETKEEFCSQIQDFCKKDYGKSVVFEVFTKNDDEQAGLDMLLKLGAVKTKSAPKKKTFLQKIFGKNKG